MNDADRKAFEEWKVEQFQKGEPRLVPSEAWQAACEWRDSQVGEPFAWASIAKNGNIRIWTSVETDVKKLAELNGCELQPIYTTPPAAQINQQLFNALQSLLESALKYKLEPSDLCVEDAKAALAAVKGQA